MQSELTPRAALRPSFPPQLVLVLGVLATSTSSTLVRLAQVDLHSLAIAAWRLTLASCILAPYALSVHRTELRSLNRRQVSLALISGVLLAVHFGTWILSLALTSVAASVVLVATAPMFVALIARFALREGLTRSMVWGLLLATVGSAIIAWGDSGLGYHRLQGDVLALVGAMAVAGYFLIGRSLRGGMSLVGYVFPVYSTAAVVLMVTAAVMGVSLTGFQPLNWVWLLLLALFPQIIGHSSLNWSLGHLPAMYVSLAVLGEPIGSAVLAWVVLGEGPSWAAVSGGVLILVGLVVAGRGQRG